MDTTARDGVGGHGTVGERVDHVGEAVAAILDEAQAAVADLGEALAWRERVRERPVLTLLGAAGLGYLLAGGLFTPTTGRLLRAGMRLAALPLVRDELLGLLEGLAAAGRTASSSPPTSGPH
jgi:hypothetical protein